MPIVNSKYDSELVSDYDATVAYAGASGKADTNRMAITGFCRGGRTTLVYAAANPKLKAAVAWYGPVGGQTNEYTPKTAMDRVAEIKVPLLGLYGAKDAGIPVDQVQKFFATLKAQGTPSELVIYPDAGHGFNADFRPDSYRKTDFRRRVEQDAPRGSRSTASNATFASARGPTGRTRRWAADDQVRHPVRQAEERRDVADVPDVLVVEAVRAQRRVVGIVDLAASFGDLEREREHRALPRRDVCFAKVDADLIGDQRILRVDAQDRAVRDEAVEAIVRACHRDDDHLALGLGEPRIAEHQRVVIREERAEFVGPARERNEHVWNEPRLLLHLEHPRADVLGQVFEFRDRVTADGGRDHANESSGQELTDPGRPKGPRRELRA